MPIRVEDDPSGAAVVRMEMPRGNAISSAFVEEMNRVLDGLAAAPRATVLTGAGSTFCVGLDLVEAYGHDRPTMARFVDRFDALFLRLWTWPAPLVAAVDGHAFAGGAIVAQACDHRVMAEGAGRFALTEVRLGIPFPAAAFEIARAATPAPARTSLLQEGRRFRAQEAVAAGLVHEATAPGGALAAALAWTRSVGEVPPLAWHRIRLDLHAPALERIRLHGTEVRERWLDHWFSDEARRRVGALRDALLSRRETVRT